jgi:REP element-mobilizing transposase RayT
MPHSYTNLLFHIVFSTKDRRPLIDTSLEVRLFPYFGGIVRQLGGRLFAVNGDDDHVHMLAEMPASISVAETVGKVKGNSSHWIHDSFATRSEFAWQRGYAAFSVSESNASAVARYIERQKVHHRKRSFEEELDRFLRRHALSVAR